MSHHISFEEEKIMLALCSSKTLRKRNLALISVILDSGYDLVIIAVNQPAPILDTLYERHGLDTSRISYVDTITKYSLGTAPEMPRTRFVTQPGDLTAIGIALTEMLKDKVPEKTVVFFDSVNAMLIHISSGNISKFLHFISSKLRLMNLGGVFLVVEKGLDPVLMSLLITFADGVIEEDETEEKNGNTDEPGTRERTRQEETRPE